MLWHKISALLVTRPLQVGALRPLPHSERASLGAQASGMWEGPQRPDAKAQSMESH